MKLNKDFIIVFCVSFVVTVASLYQTLLYIKVTPEGFVYPLVHNFEADYYWYLSLIRQGWEGNILLTSRYTPEIFSPQFVNTFFSVAGMLAHTPGFSLPLIYTILRVFGGVAVFLITYTLLQILKLSLRQRMCAFALVILSTPFWFLTNGIFRQAGNSGRDLIRYSGSRGFLIIHLRLHPQSGVL